MRRQRQSFRTVTALVVVMLAIAGTVAAASPVVAVGGPDGESSVTAAAVGTDSESLHASATASLLPDAPTVRPTPPVAVGTEVEVATTVTVPTVGFGGDSAQMTVELKRNGSVVNSKTVQVTEGETTRIAINRTLSRAGGAAFSIAASVSFGGQQFSGETPVTEIRVLENYEGASFDVPPALEDEVQQLRQQRALPVNATVLATDSSLYLVFTDEQTQTGRASVDGLALGATVQENGTTFGVITASDVTFNTTGTPTTVRAVTSNPQAYELKLVRITDDHRKAALLYDPDVVGDLTVPQTVGALGTPEHTTFYENLSARAATALANGSIAARGGSYGDEVRNLIRDVRQSVLPTTWFETAFWTNNRSRVDGIVVLPGSPAREFLSTFDRLNASHAPNGPVLYRISEYFGPTQVTDVSTIKRRSRALSGQVVEVEANLLQSRVSVQESLEHGTQDCGEDRFPVSTQQGTDCVNIVADVLLHGGVAWNANPIPTSQDEFLFVAGASSRHQDDPVQTKRGRYRIVGKVLDTKAISGRLPDGTVLVIHDLERLGGITLSGQLRSLAESRTGTIESELRRGINETIEDLTSGSTASAFVSVEVRDTGGNPVTNGYVSVQNVSTGQEVANVSLGATGETSRIALSPGVYELVVEAPGYKTFSTRVNVDSGESREIDATAESSLPAVAQPYDSDGDGGIDIGELGQAGLAYANGQLSITEYGRIAIAYANS